MVLWRSHAKRGCSKGYPQNQAKRDDLLAFVCDWRGRVEGLRRGYTGGSLTPCPRPNKRLLFPCVLLFLVLCFHVSDIWSGRGGMSV